MLSVWIGICKLFYGLSNYSIRQWIERFLKSLLFSVFKSYDGKAPGIYFGALSVFLDYPATRFVFIRRYEKALDAASCAIRTLCLSCVGQWS